MRIKKHINFGRIKKKAIDQHERNLPLLFNEIKYGIISRTQKGQDVNGNSFKAYSKSYGAEKRKNFGAGTVNLTRTQKMLNSIRFKRITGGIRLYFSSMKENSKAHGNQVKNGREFFGIDQGQSKYVLKRLKQMMRF